MSKPDDAADVKMMTLLAAATATANRERCAVPMVGSVNESYRSVVFARFDLVGMPRPSGDDREPKALLCNEDLKS